MKSLFTLCLILSCSYIFAQSKFDLNLGMRRVSAGEYLQVSTGYNWSKRHRTEFGLHWLIPAPSYYRENHLYYRNYRPKHLDDYLGFHLSHEFMILSSKRGHSLSLGLDIDKSSSWIETWGINSGSGNGRYFEEKNSYYSGLMETNLKLCASFKITSNLYLILEGGGGASWSIPTKQNNIWWRLFKPGLPISSNGIGYPFNGLSKFFSAGVRYNFDMDYSQSPFKIQ